MQINRFSGLVNNFQNSPVHTQMRTSRQVLKVTKNRSEKIIADVGCGTGHFSLQLAQRDDTVIFIDPSDRMLDQASKNAASHNIISKNISAKASDIDLETHSVDMVVSRLSSHHFDDIRGSLTEMKRIVKPGGYLVICDIEAPLNPIADEIHHAIEVLHDPSHVKTYSVSKWLKFLASSQLEPVFVQARRKEISSGIDIETWFGIAGTPENNRKEVIQILQAQPQWIFDELFIKKNKNSYKIFVRTFLTIYQVIPIRG